MIEEELILELKSNLPSMFKVISKVAKLDIGLAYMDYIHSLPVQTSRPILIKKAGILTEN